jgi:hypothetical protein
MPSLFLIRAARLATLSLLFPQVGQERISMFILFSIQAFCSEIFQLPAYPIPWLFGRKQIVFPIFRLLHSFADIQDIVAHTSPWTLACLYSLQKRWGTVLASSTR